MAERLPAIVRPNGKTYQPRVVKCYAWEDPWAWDSEPRGVIVFGTHDVARAHSFAEDMVRYWYGLEHAIKARCGWWRDGFASGERAWVIDEVGGRAGVMFSASEEPEAASDAAEEGRTDG